MKKLNKKGFSLVELIIVIAIMLVLVGVLAPTYLGQVKKSKIGTDIQNAQEIATSIAVKAATKDTLATQGSWAEVKSGASEVTDIALPSSQVDATYKWYYTYDGTTVSVSLGKGTDYVVLYPTTPTSGNWHAN